MSDTQKIIKYFAITLAILIIVSIIYGVLSIIMSITSSFGRGEMKLKGTKGTNITKNIKEMDIDVTTTNIYIKYGSNFRVETTNQYIETSTSNNKLYIEEKSHTWQFRQEKKNLTIYITKDTTFEYIKIDSDTGKVKIDELSVNELSLNLDAARLDINKLDVIDSADIDGGAGSIHINDGNINNLNLDLDVGSCTITSNLTGNNNITSDVGKLELNLLNKEDFKLKVEKDIGSVKLNGEKLTSNSIGTGKDIIKIEGDIGSIEINTNK